jgi:subtilase family serine protease
MKQMGIEKRQATLPFNPSSVMLKLAYWLLTFCLGASASSAQQATARITGDANNGARSVINGSHTPIANSRNDVGEVPSANKLGGMSIVFRRSEAQEEDLKSLIAAQQNPASTLYHKWLTPDQFAARFGMADADIEKVQSWLEQQGFSVSGVSRGKNRITFSGTVGQAEAAFGTELHYYKVNGRTDYAPSADVRVPSAYSDVVESVTNLSSFRPKPHIKIKAPAKPNFTSGQSGNHYLTPGDVTTIYDVKSAYNAGYTGVGQAIAIVGQSSVELSDVENFQTAAGMTTKDPIQVLVPGSGTAASSTGDEVESDLDLEYSGAIAKGATIYFVYVGNNTNYSVWDSIEYAIDERITPIISISYGTCETELSSSDYSTLNGILEQGASQGQSVITADGDSGSSDCYENTGLTTAERTALAVDYPSSSQYVTSIGGTEFPSGDVSSSSTTYWEAASGSDVISSVLSYIPEQVWNDDSSTNGLSSGGGGVSTLTPRPSWQTGVTGISAGSYRLVPDLSLDASPYNAGYLYCSSDTSSTDITGSCSNGFRDSDDEYLTVAGGTSFAAPIFAGMLAIINQKQNSTGQGVVNPTLYTLAANSSTYASAFHDITSGSNACSAGSTYCSSASESGFSAATGYDNASGLGSVDLYKLLTAWPATTSSALASTTTTLSAASTTIASGASDLVTITVTGQSSSLTVTPTGTLSIEVDGNSVAASTALSGGSATYSFSSTTAGSHVIEATYSGDSTYAASTGSVVLTVGSSTSSSTGTFALSATSLTLAAGSSGNSTITITPKNGYTGTIGWTVSAGSASLSNACYSIYDTSVSGTNAVTASMTIYTKSSDCSSTSATGTSTGKHKFVSAGGRAFTGDALPVLPSHARMADVTMTALLLAAWFRRRRRLHVLVTFAILAAGGFAASGCGGSGSSSQPASSSNATKGTYTLTITGTDSSSSSISASTNMTLTID